MATSGFLTVFLAILTVIAVARPAEAVVTVTTSLSPPSGNILTSYSLGYPSFVGAMQWVSDAPTDRWEACQSFFVGDDNDWIVDKITMRVRELGTSVANQNFNLEFWTVSDASDYTGDSLISAQSGTFPASGLAAGFWTFDLNAVNLSQGQHYAFVLAFDSGPDPQRFVNFVEDYSAYDSYPGGRMFYRRGTPPVWATPFWLGAKDFEFYVQCVPEPGTFALIAPTVLGIAGLAFRKMRKG